MLISHLQPLIFLPTSMVRPLIMSLSGRQHSITNILISLIRNLMGLLTLLFLDLIIPQISVLLLLKILPTLMVYFLIILLTISAILSTLVIRPLKIMPTSDLDSVPKSSDFCI